MVSWITVIWSMMAASCLTLAGTHGVAWLGGHRRHAHLVFCGLALALAVFTACEFAMMRSTDLPTYLALHRLFHAAIFLAIVMIVLFVKAFLGCGRKWLAATIIGLRALIVLLAYFPGPTFNYRHLDPLGSVAFLGETVATLSGTAQPWARLGESSVLLLLIYVADAVRQSIRGYGQVSRRSALVVGISIFFCVFSSIAYCHRLHTGEMRGPYVLSLSYIFIVLALARELGLDMTARHRSEIEAGKLRGELSHAAPVTLLGQLSTALAHELNQPLGAILRNAEAATLMLETNTPDLSGLREIIHDIHSDNRRAADLIDRLRSLLTRRQLARGKITASELVAEMVSLVRADAAAKKVILRTEIPPDLPATQGDRVQLLQVLLNLVMNAIDAADRPESSRREVLIMAGKSRNRLWISVRDSGPGIPAEALDRVFEPFFTTKYDGLGVGLAISRTIIEAHDGSLEASNPLSGGAEFRFVLPAFLS